MTWTDFLRLEQRTRLPVPEWSTACSAAQRSHEMTSQMREIRTSGSVGAPGEQSPGATRPAKPGDQFTRMLESYPLPPPIVVHSVYRPVAPS